MKTSKFSLFAFAVVLSALLVLTGCPSAEAPKNEASKANAAKNDTAKADAPKTEPAKTDAAPAADSVGVAECDEYIKKYEACLTKVAEKAPQAKGALETAFKAQRDGFKTAAANPAAKATLASTCKQAIDTAKASTAAYACEW